MTPTVDNDLKTTVRYFDLEKFENVSTEIPYTYTKFANMEEVTAELKPDELLDAANDIRKRAAMLEARKNALPENAADRSLVNGFVSQFAQLPPFSDMPTETAEERKLQRARILAAIKSTPMILEGLKQKARQTPVSTSGDGDDEK